MGVADVELMQLQISLKYLAEFMQIVTFSCVIIKAWKICNFWELKKINFLIKWHIIVVVFNVLLSAFKSTLDDIIYSQY